MQGIIPINLLIDLYIWVLIISAVVSWLVAFDVINSRNQFIYTVMNIVHRATEPPLGLIRRFVPNLGGIDISPIILIFALLTLRGVLLRIPGNIFY
jgi:YggT family protein